MKKIIARLVLFALMFVVFVGNADDANGFEIPKVIKHVRYNLSDWNIPDRENLREDKAIYIETNGKHIPQYIIGYDEITSEDGIDYGRTLEIIFDHSGEGKNDAEVIEYLESISGETRKSITNTFVYNDSGKLGQIGCSKINQENDISVYWLENYEQVCSYGKKEAITYLYFYNKKECYSIYKETVFSFIDNISKTSDPLKIKYQGQSANFDFNYYTLWDGKGNMVDAFITEQQLFYLEDGHLAMNQNSKDINNNTIILPDLIRDTVSWIEPFITLPQE